MFDLGRREEDSLDTEFSALLLRHDLRQPLAAVTVLLDSVAKVDDLPHEVAVAVHLMRQNTAWMCRLISGPADDSGARVLDLADAVEPTCSPPAAAPYRVSFERVDRAPVLVEPLGLERAARNLLANAIRAVSDGGRVEVKVLSDGGHGVLQVADNGPGFGHLAPQHGHGLVGVRQFAERFGGALECGTSPLGGALVTLSLPLAYGW